MIGSSSSRLRRLDWLRGFAIAGMILIVSPGSWSHRYGFLEHADWNGWTPADIVFPLFLFSVGVAISLKSSQGVASNISISAVLKRTIILIALGLLLNALPNLDLQTLRLPGILQRIGLCYLLAMSICLCSGRAQNSRLTVPLILLAALALLIIYWVIMEYLPVSGVGSGHYDSHYNAAAYIDRWVFGLNHLWPYGTTEGVGVTYDPEGLLSSLPATVNVLAGVVVGLVFTQKENVVRWLPMLGLGVLLTLIGLGLDSVFSINKKLWSISFVFLSTGLSICLFAVMSALTTFNLKHLMLPLEILGSNAILAFILSTLLVAYSGFPFFAGVFEEPIALQSAAFNLVSEFVSDPVLASLICAIGILVLITVVLSPLHKKRIFLRI